MRYLPTTALILVASLTNGCASIVSDSTSSVFIGAYDSKGDPVQANCIVTNDEGVYRTRSNRNVTIGKDKDEITVDCRNDTHDGQTVNDSASVGFGYWAANFFLIDLCIISCFVDGLSGSWVKMPVSIDVAMDEKTTDQKDEGQ